MEQRPVDWEAEQQYLSETLAVARARWEAAGEDSVARADALKKAREEMQEAGALDTGGLYSAQGFLDLLEAGQMASSLAVEEAVRQSSVQTVRMLARMLETPYFARIDFLFDGDDEEERIYIGRGTLTEPKSKRIYVYDWRAPVSSLFYQYGVGPAQYEAPAGRITGELRLKRQYEIRHGRLEYFFDADTHIVDDFLRDLLSRPASRQMKSIVETIQRDQDTIIRDLESDLLMVQGAAGSGKTSVALHRVAYLLYEGLKKARLSPREIAILSPNSAFAQYIAHVLPDLGESRVQTLLFEELLRELLPGRRVQPYADWVEKRLQGGGQGCGNIKRSRAYIRLLDRLVAEVPRRWIPFADVCYAGQILETRERMRTNLCNVRRNMPLGIRLRMLEKGLWEQVHARQPARVEYLLEFARNFPAHGMEREAFARSLSIAEHARLLRQIRAFTRVDAARLYRQVFADPAAFRRLAGGLIAPGDIEDFRKSTLAALAAPEIPYDDAVAIAYLQARIQGFRAYSGMRQVVVDEAQDMGALQVALLGLLFPRARFTVLGDRNQTLVGEAGPGFYEEIQGILQKEQPRLYTLDKSFRSTREIWEFCAHFLPEGAAGECFSRSGARPAIHEAADSGALEDKLLEMAGDFAARGHKTIACICKTEADAKALHARIRDRANIRLIRSDSASALEGFFVIPLFMAKGLEFDVALIWDADSAHYASAEDKNLLYVGCTRALHELHLFYAGERSPLLPGKEDGHGL